MVTSTPIAYLRRALPTCQFGMSDAMMSTVSWTLTKYLHFVPLWLLSVLSDTKEEVALTIMSSSSHPRCMRNNSVLTIASLYMRAAFGNALKLFPGLSQTLRLRRRQEPNVLFLTGLAYQNGAFGVSKDIPRYA